MNTKITRTHSNSAKIIFDSLKSEISLGRLNSRQRLIESELIEHFIEHFKKSSTSSP